MGGAGNDGGGVRAAELAEVVRRACAVRRACVEPQAGLLIDGLRRFSFATTTMIVVACRHPRTNHEHSKARLSLPGRVIVSGFISEPEK